MTVTGQVSVLFLLIIVGFIVRKIGIVSESISGELSHLIMKVTLPAFIISNMNYDFSIPILLNSMTLLIISLSVYICIIVLSGLVVKIIKPNDNKASIYKYVLAFSNVGFMGYPVVGIMYGSMGVFYTAIYNLPFNLLTWTYGVYLMTQGSDMSKNMKTKEKIKRIFNPGLFAILIGFTLFLTSTNLPTPIEEAIKMLGRVTTPLSMLVIGFLLTEISFKTLYDDYKDYVIIAIRLLVSPVLVFVVLTLIGLEDMLLGIPVLIVAMPAAANTAVFAKMYNNDAVFASKMIFLSTLLSLLTIPLILMLL